MSTPAPYPIAVVCAWCKALMSGGVLPASHGICRRCQEQFRKGLR
jgi:hypothetical protein